MHEQSASSKEHRSQNHGEWKWGSSEQFSSKCNKGPLGCKLTSYYQQEQWVVEDALEDIEVFDAKLPAVDLVEECHHHEGIED